MKQFVALLILITAMVSYGAYQADARRHKLEADLKDARDDNANLAHQLDNADKAAELDKQTIESQLRLATVARDAAIKERDDAKEHLDILASNHSKLHDTLARVEAEAREAAKAALAAHNTCPPPTNDNPPDSRELAPRVHKSNGEFAWPEDYDAAFITARRLNRPVLAVFVTDACPHCQVLSNDVLPLKRVGDKLFVDYVPVWVMVDSKTSHEYQIAKAIGVNKFQYPAVVIQWPDSTSSVIFRPSKDPDKFLQQVEAESAELRKP